MDLGTQIPKNPLELVETEVDFPLNISVIKAHLIDIVLCDLQNQTKIIQFCSLKPKFKYYVLLIMI